VILQSSSALQPIMRATARAFAIVALDRQRI
jgi:hypothetical protein